MIIGTHLRVLSKSFQTYTNMTEFGRISNILRSFALDISSLSNERVNSSHSYNIVYNKVVSWKKEGHFRYVYPEHIYLS